MTIPDAYMHPPMMAIGDSLFNGVRSLTITADMARLSAPAQIARALGINDFSCPDYQRPVILNLEKWLHMFPDIDAIKADLTANAQYWLPGPTSASGRLCFDNLSIASALVSDLYQRSWTTADSDIAKLKAQYGDKIATPDGPLAALFFDTNTKFILNPQGLDEFKSFTPLDWVRARKPKRLLVNIGSNNGLWSMGFNASTSAEYTAADMAQFTELAKQLAALPPEIEHIYFNNLALPSTVANLMPIPDDAVDTDRPPPGGYYTMYENRFGLGYGTLDTAQMQALDDKVRRTNTAVADALRKAFQATSERLHIVDLAAVLEQYDNKAETDSPTNGYVAPDGKRYTNLMLEAAPWPLPAFRCGGLQSLDGMHLTTLGYGLMARQVLGRIAAAEGVEGSIDLAAALAQDSLLMDMPRAWSVVLWLWRDIRRAKAGREDAVADEQKTHVEQLMELATQFHPHPGE